jgi:ACT domain-containing protein/outer membrane murein-binding lipoprotein Lpp
MVSRVKSGQRSLLTSVILSSLLLGSCAAAPNQKTESAASSAAPQTAKANSIKADSNLSGSDTSQRLMGVSANRTPTQIPQKSQLIKTATLVLQVKEIEPSIQSATKIVESRGGDILSLQDEVPQDAAVYHTASFSFRVPQAQLDATLTDLSKVGTVESRAIQAEDVANQIVDFEARLKNLRRSETVVLSIMDRSGSISDVLKVSQELSQLRSEIEQIQAQVQSLRQRVAYSTLNLSLKTAIIQNPQGVPLGDRLQDSWAQSTRAVGQTTTHLLQLGIWLFVFSPYLAGIVVLVVLLRKILRRRQPTKSSASD